MTNNYTLKDLIKDSVRVDSGMVAVWPHRNCEEVINFDVATFNGSYASNNGTLAFVTDNSLYVTPSTRRAYSALSDFSEKYFYVPFSNGDYPKSQQLRWTQLRAMQKKLSEEDFIHDCNEYCDKHCIDTLDESILSKCFVMPTTGVKVKHLYFEDTYYPILNGTCFDCTVPDRLGKFCKNNGKVVFVYRDGRTMVAKGYRIIEALKNAGYKESGLFVPFSNGEQILDPVLKNCWESIEK